MSSKTFPSPRRSPTGSCAMPKSASGKSKYNQIVGVYVFAALLVSLIVYFIARDKYSDVHTWARFPVWMSNPVLMMLFLIAGLVLAGYATAVASMRTDARWAVAVQAIFLAVAVIVLVNVYLVYRVHNFLAAFYLSLLAFVLLIVHFYAVMAVCKTTALLVVPVIVFVAMSVYLLWYMADESSDCVATTIPVFNNV